jgi:MFS family permease
MHVNYIAILVAAVLQWLLGALWYGVIFRKSWKKLVGYAEGEKPKNVIFGAIAALVGCLLLSYTLAHVTWVGAGVFSAGTELGVICWLGFMAAPLFTQHIYENRRANLFAINAGYWLLAMALGGGILAAFHK